MQITLAKAFWKEYRKMSESGFIGFADFWDIWDIFKKKAKKQENPTLPLHFFKIFSIIIPMQLNNIYINAFSALPQKKFSPEKHFPPCRRKNSARKNIFRLAADLRQPGKTFSALPQICGSLEKHFPPCRWLAGAKKSLFLAAIMIITPAAIHSAPVSDEKYRLRAAQIADSMNIKALAAQVIITAIGGKKAVLTDRNKELLAEVPTGGVILFGYNLAQSHEENRAFIEKLSGYMAGMTLPPFIAVDQEGGAVQRIGGKAALPSPLSYWERLKSSKADAVVSAVEREANQSAQELRRIGFNLNLAPLVEVLTEGNKAFIKERSYGPDQAFAIKASAAFIRGMDKAGVAATIKHFPGNSSDDPHVSKSVMAISDKELKKLSEPFRELAHLESPASIMVSHVIIPSWDTIPLTRSPIAIKRLREMGFDGIIMSDDFSMAAAEALPEVGVVEALIAGVDMVITSHPDDLRKIYASILGALEKGTLSKERIKEAAERVIYQKIRYGIAK